MTAPSSGPAADRADRADQGLFGPGSITWRVHGDPILWVGGLRALLLQALHPDAMAGLAANADLRADPWGRLIRTAHYVGTVTFGTTEHATAAGDGVRRVHQRLGVDDDHLLRWVHCCLVDSFATARLSEQEADRYVFEQTRLAPLVGLDAHSVPTDARSLADYFTTIRPELRLTREATDAARLVIVPPMPVWVQLLTPARLGWTGIAGLAMAMLPRWARRLYRLPGLPVTDVAAGAGLRLLSAGLRAVPARAKTIRV